MAALEIIVCAGLAVAFGSAWIGWADHRHQVRAAAAMALRMGTAKAIEDALVFHRFPKKIREHLEHRCEELRAEEILRHG